MGSRRTGVLLTSALLLGILCGCPGTAASTDAGRATEDAGPELDGGSHPSGEPDAARDAGSADGGALTDAGPPDGGCPPGMTWVPHPTASFCIDSRETTFAEYDVFLASAPAPGTGRCAWNTVYEPSLSKQRQQGPLPVQNVDWCDAAAYCAFKGKRLCGALGGAALSPFTAEREDPNRSEWMRACSAAGTRAYPYGSIYDEGACNTFRADGGSAPLTLPPGTSPRCEGGYAGIYDLSGNVWEWEDNCSASAPEGAQDKCEARGGEARPVTRQDDSEHSLACRVTAAVLYDALLPRNWSFDAVGIRCCRTP